MLVIKNDTRVADIYLGEFMRLHSHYAFRQAVAIFLEQNPEKTPEDFRQRFLIEGRTAGLNPTLIAPTDVLVTRGEFISLESDRKRVLIGSS
jgi:hypothetical protein